MRKENKTKIIYIILLSLFTVILFISAYKIIIWEKNNRDNKKILEQISKFITVNETSKKDFKEYIVDFDGLKEINEDTVAWLKVNGVNINNAVVKTTDNNYYVYHNFIKKRNDAGWLFADYRNKLDGLDKNIIIYGHNRKDNSMFGTLDNVLREEWYNNKENYIIELITEKRQYRYQVFSIYKTQKEDYYIKTEFEKNEFENFTNRLKERSIKDFNIEVSENDRILTLSTCSNIDGYRTVLHAKKIR